MADELAARGIQFVFVYTREAHPGERYPHHSEMQQKLRHARAMVQRWGIARPMLVDDLQGTVHRAYGELPNMTYIVGAAGSVLYRADWTDARSIRAALDQLVLEREQRRGGARLTPFYQESMQQRTNTLEPFMEGLLLAGPRAVEEFIVASSQTRGEAAARPMRDWWERARQRG